MARVLGIRERDGFYRRGRLDSRDRRVDDSSFVQASQKVPPTGSVRVLNGWRETILCSPRFMSGRRHHFPAPTWMSGHNLYSPVALGLACWWLSLVSLVLFAGLWVWGFFFVGPDPKTGFLPQVSPRCSGTLAPYIRSIACRRASRWCAS